MKVCPVCSSVYASSAAVCRNDGTPLVDLREDGAADKPRGRRGRHRGRRPTEGAGHAWDDMPGAAREETIVYHGQSQAIAAELSAARESGDHVAAQARAEKSARIPDVPARRRTVADDAMAISGHVSAPQRRPPVNMDQPTQAFRPRAPTAQPKPQRAASGPIIPPSSAKRLPAVAPGSEAVTVIGELIDSRYRVEEILGRGGMGTVYRVEQVHLGKQMALKVLHAALLADRSLVSRFMREARAMSRLSSPHTVRVHDCGQSGSHLYLAMELLLGTSLDQVLRGGRLPWRRAVRMLLQICDSLGEAHRFGVIHRDLKPENIIVVKNKPTDDFIKVLDFGLAKVQGLADPYTVESKLDVFGTPFYMSPEQVLSGTIDHRTDMYALGAMAYRMLTGEHVFAEYKSTFEMLSAHVSLPAPRVTTTSPGAAIPDVIADVIGSLLEKDPDQRIQTMQALSQTLQDVLAEDPEDAHPTTMQQGAAPEPSGPRTQMYTLETEAVVGDFGPGGLDDATQIHVPTLASSGEAPSPYNKVTQVRMPRQSKLPDRSRVDSDSGGFSPVDFSQSQAAKKRDKKLTQDMHRSGAELVDSPQRASMTQTYGRKGDRGTTGGTSDAPDIAEEAAKKLTETSQFSAHAPEVSVARVDEPSQIRAGTRAEPWNETDDSASGARRDKNPPAQSRPQSRTPAMQPPLTPASEAQTEPQATEPGRKERRQSAGTSDTQAYVGALHPDVQKALHARKEQNSAKESSPRRRTEAGGGDGGAPLIVRSNRETFEANRVLLDPDSELIHTIERTIADGGPTLPAQSAPDDRPIAIDETMGIQRSLAPDAPPDAAPLLAIESELEAALEAALDPSEPTTTADDDEPTPIALGATADREPIALGAAPVPRAPIALPLGDVAQTVIASVADEDSDPAASLDPALIAAISGAHEPVGDLLSAPVVDRSKFESARIELQARTAPDAASDFEAQVAAALLDAGQVADDERIESPELGEKSRLDSPAAPPTDAEADPLEAALLAALDSVTDNGSEPKHGDAQSSRAVDDAAGDEALALRSQEPVVAPQTEPESRSRRSSTHLAAMLQPKREASFRSKLRQPAPLPLHDEQVDTGETAIAPPLPPEPVEPLLDDVTAIAPPLPPEPVETLLDDVTAIAPPLPPEPVEPPLDEDVPELPPEAFADTGENADAPASEDAPESGDIPEIPEIPPSVAVDEAVPAIPEPAETVAEAVRPVDMEELPVAAPAAPPTVVQPVTIRETGPLPRPASGRPTGRIAPPPETIAAKKPAPHGKTPIFARTQNTGPVPEDSQRIVHEPTYTLKPDARERLRQSIAAPTAPKPAADMDSPWTKSKKKNKRRGKDGSTYWSKVVMTSRSSSTKRSQIALESSQSIPKNAVRAPVEARTDRIRDGRVELEVGEIVGNIFKIEARVGHGNVGVVYRAQNTQSGEAVAVKILHPHIGAQPEAATRLHTIAHDAARLNNPAAEPIIDFGKTSESMYCVTRWFEARTLEQVVQAQGRLALRVVGRVAGKILNALEAAHSAAVIHGDLSARNIFIIERSNEPHFLRVIDFELATLARVGGQTPQHLVHPFAVSPEQLAGRRPSPETDFYALGWIIYRMLGGQDPYVAPSELDAFAQMQDLQRQIMNDDLTPLDQVATETLLPGLITLVSLLLARQPHMRPGSVQEIRELLKKAGRGQPVAVQPRRIAETTNFSGPPVDS